MAKVKSYYTELADEQVTDIIKSYTDGKITKEKAKADISKVDNLELIDIDDENIQKDLRNNVLPTKKAFINDLKDIIGKS